MNNWKGTSMNDMYRGHGPWEFDIPPIYASKYHTILYELPPNLINPPKPHFSSHTYHWNDGYVHMPYSRKNLFPTTDDEGRDIVKSRWELIKDSLLQPINTSGQLEAAIHTYNSKRPKLLALHYLFDDVFSEEESDLFFENILPGIVQLALKLPEILPGSIPLLNADSCKSISLSQLQVASLLANAFLCTFPWKKEMAGAYPGINFSSLFTAHLRPDFNECVAEKIKCIIQYFRRVLSIPPVGVITFERKHFRRNTVPRWDKLDNNLGNTRIHIDSSGTIEDNGLGLLQADFANKFIGGGVLGFGCVQEEIRFVICPELIISRLFTEKLGNLEAVVITGVERFSKYSGYGNMFKWDGDFKDETPFDVNGRRQTTITVIDATHFDRSADQFNSSLILRELNKAYAGFHSRDDIPLPAVATGNWGCGAFGGDPHLKSLIQLMACSATKRDMVYYTFDNKKLRDSIYNMYSFIATSRLTICDLWRLMCRFIHAKLPSTDFVPYIQQGFFDNKKQSNIGTYLHKILPTNDSIPSTSRNVGTTYKNPATQNYESIKKIDSPIKAKDLIDSDSVSIDLDFNEIIESSQIDTKVSIINKSDPKLIDKQHKDVINLINIIDRDEIIVTKCEFAKTGSFLSQIDELAKRRKEEKICSALEDRAEIEEMDVDDIIELIETTPIKENVNTGTSSNVNLDSGKRKITDYFSKVRN